MLRRELIPGPAGTAHVKHGPCTGAESGEREPDPRLSLVGAVGMCHSDGSQG